MAFYLVMKNEETGKQNVINDYSTHEIAERAKAILETGVNKPSGIYRYFITEDISNIYHK